MKSISIGFFYKISIAQYFDYKDVYFDEQDLYLP